MRRTADGCGWQDDETWPENFFEPRSRCRVRGLACGEMTGVAEAGQSLGESWGGRTDELLD